MLFGYEYNYLVHMRFHVTELNTVHHMVNEIQSLLNYIIPWESDISHWIPMEIAHYARSVKKPTQGKGC